MKELVVIFKAKPRVIKSALEGHSDKEYVLTPFLGYVGGYAGVGFIDETDGKCLHVISSCGGRLVSAMPIVKAWRAFQMMQRLDKMLAGSAYLVWDIFSDNPKPLEGLKRLVPADVNVNELYREIMRMFPPDDVIIKIATDSILMSKKIDFDSLTIEYLRENIAVDGKEKEFPHVIEAYSMLMRIIESQNNALRSIGSCVQDHVCNVENTFK